MSSPSLGLAKLQQGDTSIFLFAPAVRRTFKIVFLTAIARGYSNRQMAQTLGITEKTAGNHVVHIYEKIGCSTRSAATLFAMQHYLLGEPG